MLKKLFTEQNIVQWISMMVVIVMSTIGAVYGYGTLTAQVEGFQEKIEKVEEDLDGKASTERFDDLREDVKEIKKMVNLLLRKSRKQ